MTHIARLLVLASFVGGLLHAGEQPHIVLFVADDLGYADCGFNGGTQIATPHLDRLAAEHPEVVERLRCQYDAFGAAAVSPKNSERAGARP